MTPGTALPMMILTNVFLLTALLAPLVPPLIADSPSAQQEATPAEIVEDVIDEYDDAMAEFQKRYEEAETDEARDEAFKEHYPRADEYAVRLWPVIDAAPASEAALAAIVWVMKNRAAGDRQEECSALLLEHHLASPKIGEVCSVYSYDSSAEAEHFLRTVREKGAADSARGPATYALAGVLGSRLDLHRSIDEADEEMREQMAQWYGEEALALVAEIDAEAVKAERRKLLLEARDRYGDVLYGRSQQPLKLVAGAEIFELEHLQAGMVAPEIEGPDLDGVDFKLSDYRGKVVFLDFWGDW